MISFYIYFISSEEADSDRTELPIDLTMDMVAMGIEDCRALID